MSKFDKMASKAFGKSTRGGKGGKGANGDQTDYKSVGVISDEDRLAVMIKVCRLVLGKNNNG